MERMTRKMRYMETDLWEAIIGFRNIKFGEWKNIGKIVQGEERKKVFLFVKENNLYHI
jgi:hypothetical protein